ncbi:hypothetical protein GCM10009612_50660 [Streptomyces beijiangensis]
MLHPLLPPLSGTEPFAGLDDTVLDFWRFAISDLRTNAVRGYLAEFLVARAVGARTNRLEWDAYDILSPEGIRIEVKAGGYVQAWSQTQASPQAPVQAGHRADRGRHTTVVQRSV